LDEIFGHLLRINLFDTHVALLGRVLFNRTKTCPVGTITCPAARIDPNQFLAEIKDVTIELRDAIRQLDASKKVITAFVAKTKKARGSAAAKKPRRKAGVKKRAT
jgi:hypothetical protein